MAVVSTFGQWEKDAFFSAAEEVQESSDIMESLYRTWQHDSTSGICSEELEELQRELQAALGTAKWQLEQFQQAIDISHEKYSSEESTISRRRQFVSAIENQIKRVEISLANILAKEGKPSFTWVKLEEGERDDLIAFLSSDSLSSKKPERAAETLKEVPCKREEDVIIQIGSLNGEPEVVHDGYRASSIGYLRGFEAQPRVKLFKNDNLRVENELPKRKNSFSNYLNLKGFPFFSQRFTTLSERSRSCFYRWKENAKSSNLQAIYSRGDGTIQNNFQPRRSIRATFLLLLSIVLIVPFLIYAN
ncbi:Syntaxin/t-SNARE family protein [Rhynchospora pubera]|uniref:Syntaxin/t-SNARE family protein n=1 Tax=Rhynchospora pubera TaxID=906938 RepID=A0AAV8FIU5_9POAL|nr:Syntaxin/t-SNARE family protein [Rhynchospora pubera]